MNPVIDDSRRRFLKGLGLASGGLIAGIPLTGCASTALPNEQTGDIQPNALLQITRDNQINFYLPRTEMGQGVYTGLTTILAEELDIAPEKINVINVGDHPDYNNPEYGLQVTGGSNSIRVHFKPLRQLAANMRLVIRQAASRVTQEPIENISTENGNVVIAGKYLPYGDFAEVASQLEFPENATLTPKSNFKYIGKLNQRLDAKAKSTGTAQFGLDIEFDGLHRAALKRCPQFGGTVKSFDGSKAKDMPGVKSVVAIHNGVAVVAEHYYQAKAALQKLEIKWNLPETLSAFSSNSTAKGNGQNLFKEALDLGDYDNAHEEGDGLEALQKSDNVIEADYWAPYLAHATMEPMNCTAKFNGDKLEIWTSTQNPQVAKNIAAFYGDVSKDDVTVHGCFIGGGFGRRTVSDYVAEAVAIAKAAGVPVQLVWSREDDTQHDYYRPASMARFKIGVSNEGMIDSWNVTRSGPNIMPYTIDEVADAMMPGFLPNGMVDWISKAGYGLFDGWTVDPASVEGLFEDYDAPHKNVDHVTVDPGLPLGFWRSVGHSYSGFFKESMMDEIAIKQKVDPIEFRLKHLNNNPRLANVLKQAAEKAGWNKNLANGHYHGVAVHTSFQSYVAEIAEVSVENNQIKIHKVTCAVDCGLAVNPDIVRDQMESGIIFGLTTALHGEITLKDGAVEQSNFHNYPILRINETPDIEVLIVDSDESPSGVGEPGLPPIAAAVGNAIFAATGKRLRSLPLKLS
ncbi:xanthine dehydrogenase family protein molybdopterin-binding subunit [Bermanella marisrubri]|uniref:Aerobic-type carbon monoxide dehydrogenase large subunit CoxL/CutL-like protein n=1 Tax=Bermanella marisrubri TaxID=207949 RepID=Q1N658_9GAMM|nr:molybdopterin cofactor-binding domain-containing protein [Bermanella marisrubri]EAT13734.1 Aerobic-type carbon monoxide dehydrogenase large subunit CoxL/CutL-like protein [Oceanobacter sp. RED65] [Bermanella marisrubri]QIZ84510.1 xanthine dehydrogenase family protein molybdopterin-binding subunit [Bermanella marisrubri]